MDNMTQAEKRISQGLHPIPDYEVQMDELIKARLRHLKKDSLLTGAMVFLFGVLVALVSVLVLLEESSIG